MPETASIMVIVMLASTYVYGMLQYCAVAKCLVLVFISINFNCMVNLINWLW